MLKNQRNQIFAISSIILSLATSVQSASGATLSIADASVILQSTISDSDVFLLTALTTPVSGTVDYNSTSVTPGWSGTLSGTYNKDNLNVSYIGNLLSYPSGPVTWNSSGNYGSIPWNSSGSATFVSTSATGFNIIFNDSLTVGSNSGSINYIIPGIQDESGTFFDGEVGTGTVSIEKSTYSNLIAYSYLARPITIGPLRFTSDLIILREIPIPLPSIFNKGEVVFYPNSPGIESRILVAAVPEPTSTLTLLALGTLGAASTIKRKLKPSKSSEKETTQVS